jgi:peptidoglycan/xylan/chitin deacetylase (PgdA/CDA1 family)
MVEFLSTHELSSGDRSRKVVLMTYDDKVNRTWIDWVLDAFERVGGKASFFFTGNILYYFAEQVRRIVREGHVFGSHGLLHVPYTQLRTEEIRTHFQTWLDLVEEVVPGYRPKFCRFPFGNRDERALRVAAEFGLQSVHWTLASGGMDEGTHDRVVENVTDGCIVLSHVSHYYDVIQAERILRTLTSMGYALESLDTAIAPSDSRVALTGGAKKYAASPSKAAPHP